ncbi:hypothetical protein TWF788_008216 [Orbilia oligospora]|nr:hypothetical protein TWF788_008216 [Orbilia oligospora]
MMEGLDKELEPSSPRTKNEYPNSKKRQADQLGPSSNTASSQWVKRPRISHPTLQDGIESLGSEQTYAAFEKEPASVSSLEEISALELLLGFSENCTSSLINEGLPISQLDDATYFEVSPVDNTNYNQTDNPTIDLFSPSLSETFENVATPSMSQTSHKACVQDLLRRLESLELKVNSLEQDYRDLFGYSS